jgi:hypothetical protein
MLAVMAAGNGAALRVLLTALTALGAFGCGSGGSRPAEPRAETASSTPPAPAPLQSSAAVQASAPAPAAARVTHVAITEPAALAGLQKQGFALGRLLFASGAESTLELDRDTALRDVFAALRRDIAQAKRVFPLAKVTSMDGFRLFDERWLASSEMSFELSGVFNRLDRRAFYEGTCGEVRFTYRLRYATTHAKRPMSSRLPMTVNVVFLAGDDAAGCKTIAESWQSPEALAGERLTSFLLAANGPLGSAAQKRWSLKAVETNLQTIRLQSTVQTTLGGHIEYSLHVFHARDAARSGFAPAVLENMPDVARIAGEPALRQELVDYLRLPDTLAAIDRGTLQLPERFLAKQATSISPRALTRLANRPFRRLLRDDDFAKLDLAAFSTIRSPKALLRRLDGASCTGCHQSRSIAGFHHVGNDTADVPAGSSLLSGSSSHLRADLERREGYVASLARGETPAEQRPLPERQGVGQGYGAPCGLGDAGFSDWTCAEGFRCVALEDTEVGTCLADHGVGAPCQYGSMVPNERPERDHVAHVQRHACEAKLGCDPNLHGFPLGSCRASCAELLPNGTCGPFLDVDGYQNCLRGGISDEECTKKFVFPTQLRACDADTPCRQDYVCTRTSKSDVGACMPPYFVFPLRNDGYPLKR